MDMMLLHGRDRPDEQLNDWGFDGPTLHGVQSFQQRYRITTTVKFVSRTFADLARNLTGWPIWDDDILEVPWHGDLIATCEPDGHRRYYADVVLVNRSAEEEIERIVECMSDARAGLNHASQCLERQP